MTFAVESEGRGIQCKAVAVAGAVTVEEIVEVTEEVIEEATKVDEAEATVAGMVEEGEAGTKAIGATAEDETLATVDVVEEGEAMMTEATTAGMIAETSTAGMTDL